MKEFLSSIGISLPDVIAGLSGGIVNAIVFQRTSPWAYVGSMLVGALVANYFGLTVSEKTGIGVGAAGFLVGMSGIVICQTLVSVIPSMITRWSQNPGTSK